MVTPTSPSGPSPYPTVNVPFRLFTVLPPELQQCIIGWMDFPEQREFGLADNHSLNVIENSSFYLSLLGFQPETSTCAARIRQLIAARDTPIKHCLAKALLTFGDPCLNKLRYVADLIGGTVEVGHFKKREELLSRLHTLGYPIESVDKCWTTYLNRIPDPIERHLSDNQQIHLLRMKVLGFCQSAVAIEADEMAARILANTTNPSDPDIKALAQSVVEISSFSRLKTITANFTANSHLTPSIPLSFLELLEQRRLYEGFIPTRSRDQAIAQALSKIQQTRSNTPHIRCLAAIQLAIQRLQKRTYCITDQEACEMVDRMRRQDGLRESIRTHAGIVFFSLGLARRTSRNIALPSFAVFVRHCLDQDLVDQGFYYQRDLWGKIQMLYLQLKLGKQMLPLLQAKQFAVDLARDPRLPPQLRGYYLYARILLKYQMSKSHRDVIARKDVLALIELMHHETNQDQVLDIRLLLAKMNMDLLTKPSDLPYATAWAYVNEVWRKSKPLSERRIDAGLLLANMAVLFPTDTKDDDLPDRCLTEIMRSNCTIEQRYEAMFLLAQRHLVFGSEAMTRQEAVEFLETIEMSLNVSAELKHRAMALWERVNAFNSWTQDTGL